MSDNCLRQLLGQSVNLMVIPGGVNIKGNRIQVSDSIGSRFRVAGLRFEDKRTGPYLPHTSNLKPLTVVYPER